MLRHWVEFHFYDFERSPELLIRLKKFVKGVKSKKLQKWVSSIHRSLQKVSLLVEFVFLFTSVLFDERVG